MALNIIVPLEAIKAMLSTMTICRKCRVITAISLTVETVGISSEMIWKCERCQTISTFGGKELHKTKSASCLSLKASKKGDELCSLNVRFIIAMEMLGLGQSGAATIAGMLSLNKNFFRKDYIKIQEKKVWL